MGAGYFSQFHFDGWKRLPEVDIVGVCDLDRHKAAHAAEQLGIERTYTDAVAALDELSPDFIDIITPPATHLPLIEQAAARGVAIICQKPLAADWPTARQIASIVERSGVRCMVHENFRFQPWYREIKRLLAGGAIGNQLHSLYFRCRPGDGWGEQAYLSRQPYFRQMPRFLLHETGVHFIDTFRYLAGEMREVHAVLRRLNPVITGEDTGLVTFRFANGAVGVWDANRFNESTASDPRYTFGEMLVEANGGSLRLYDDGRVTIQRLGEPEHEHAYARPRRGFGGDCVYFTQQHFVQQLAAGAEFETELGSYLTNLAVQEAAYQSARIGRPVELAAKNAPPLPRIIDLSLPIDEHLPHTSVATFKTLTQDGWNATMLTLYSHCGTHMDSPRHFLDGGSTIDQTPLASCVGPARLLDLTPVEPRELLTVQRLAPWTDRILAGDRLLLRTDWHRRFGTPAYRHALPRISPELARWLVAKGVSLVGVEPPSVADVNDIQEVTEVHQILLRAGVVIVEGLVNLDQIQREVVDFIALPLKVVGGDATPVRAIAVES